MMPMQKRFDAKWVLDEATGCKLWTASVSPSGYGYFQVGDRCRRAHSVAWVMAKGPVPEGLCVCHTCDTLHVDRTTYRRCVNTEHMFLGTHQQNMADRDSKGRQARGDRHGSKTKPGSTARGERSGMRRHPECVVRGIHNGKAKLSDDDVREIRRLRVGGGAYVDIAERFSVAASTVYGIVSGRARPLLEVL